MNKIVYRLGGYEETWRELPGEVYGPHVAQEVAGRCQDLLRHIGYPFAQAEVREVEAVASGVISAGGMVVVGEHFPDQEQVTLIGGFLPPTGEETPLLPVVEGGHGETLPAYWNASASMASSVPSKMVLTTPAKCEFCTSTVLVRAHDMGEGRNMLLCVDCRENIKRGKEIMG